MVRATALAFLLFALPAAALVVYWDPPNPVPGGTVTIFYNVIEGTLPDDANPVYIHLGVNGWQDVHDYPMTPDSVPGWWRFAYAIPLHVTVIDFVFTDLRGNWDNNGGIGIDWHISLTCSWSPFLPGPNDSIQIVVREPQGGTLVWFVVSAGRTGPPLSLYWPPGSSLTADGEAVSTPLTGPWDDGSWRVTLGPFQSARQVVDSVKFRIHRAGGSGDAALFEILFDHTPGAQDPLVTIVAPAEGTEVLGPVGILAEADSADAVELWGGPDSLGTFTAPPYEAIWTPSHGMFGPVHVIAKAVGQTGRVSFARCEVFVPPVVEPRPAPPGIDDGVTVDGTSVTFALYAPAKEYVALKGSFNREFPNGELMYLSGDTLWWLTRDLPPGTYTYQYNIEGIKVIADPWSSDVRWVSPGTNTESGTYGHAKSVFTVGAERFPWTDGQFRRPGIDELVIYELHVGDFAGLQNGIGTYAHLMAKLDEGYFDSLGVNAVELMPLNEFEGANSWGYNPSFFRAPESAYGTLDDLRALVDRFHAHGIAVILDVVFNHMWGSAPLFQLYQPLDDWDYRHHDYANCPYFHNYPSQWGYKLQHWREVGGRRYRTWKYVTDALRTWVEDYHVDGFRYDAAWGVGWDGYNANGMSFYTWFVNELDPSLIQIVEEDNASRVNTTETDAGWNFSYYHAMKANLMQITDSGHVWGNMYGLANELSFSAQGFVDPWGPVNYVESHDETRLMYEATVYQGMSYETALKKSRLGSVVLLTGTGTPMLYAGQEFAQNGTSRDQGGGIIPQPLQWENLSTPSGYALFQHYRRLIWLRSTHPILRSGSFRVVSRSNATKHLVYWRGDATTQERVVVAANFDVVDHAVDIEFPSEGTWYEFTEDDSLEVVGNSYPGYLLPASTARVFVNRRTWPTVVGEPPVPEALSVWVYPNPFSTGTTIAWAAHGVGGPHVRLHVYDLMGRLVKGLDPPEEGATFFWNGRDAWGREVPDGAYLVRLRAGNRSCERLIVRLR